MHFGPAIHLDLWLSTPFYIILVEILHLGNWGYSLQRQEFKNYAPAISICHINEWVESPANTINYGEVKMKISIKKFIHAR